MSLRAPRSLALAAALLATALPGGSRGQPGAAPDVPADLPLPGPAPRPRLQAVDGIGLPTDARCARCHEEIAAEWERSLHRGAWQNSYFVRAYALEPTPFCRKCHAPGADPSAEPPRAAQEIGVGCTACHVVPAGIVGTRDRPAREGGHPVLGDARLATPAACAGCHQFPFPAPGGFDAGPMQDTLGEHRRSAASATPCQGCHMPPAPSRGEARGGTHRSHAFRVQGDRAMLARAVDVKSASLGAGELRLDLAMGDVGHAFPTGDLHRRVEVRVAPIDAAGHLLAAGSTEVLARTVGPERIAPNTVIRVERTDDRLTGPRTLVLRVPPATRRARWQIVWQRLPPALAARLGLTMSDHEMIVREGVVTR